MSKIKEREIKLIELTKEYCSQNLDDDYSQLSEKLIKKLGRKRSVPFESGKIEIWAAGVIHALGTINFLFDKSGEPHVTASDINNYFGTNQSTVTGKSKQIRDLLKLAYFDKDFSTRGIIKQNSLKNMVVMNGFIVSIR